MHARPPRSFDRTPPLCMDPHAKTTSIFSEGILAFYVYKKEGALARTEGAPRAVCGSKALPYGFKKNRWSFNIVDFVRGTAEGRLREPSCRGALDCTATVSNQNRVVTHNSKAPKRISFVTFSHRDEIPGILNLVPSNTCTPAY